MMVRRLSNNRRALFTVVDVFVFLLILSGAFVVMYRCRGGQDTSAQIHDRWNERAQISRPKGRCFC